MLHCEVHVRVFGFYNAIVNVIQSWAFAGLNYGN